jgi:3-methyladenine DNA glycosylase AlkD
MTAKEVQKRLRSQGNPSLAASCRRFFKKEDADKVSFLGLRAEILRKLAKEFKDLPLPEVEVLLHSKFHEERILALLILGLIVPRASESKRKQIYDFYLAHIRYVNNWALVDASASALVGTYLFDKCRQPLYGLARSPNLWERRIAMVATQHFIRQKDYSETLGIAEMLLGDEEDLIHKAVGWMLREVGKRDRALLESFLRKNWRIMPRTTLRYAIERFAEEDRKAYLHGTFRI